MKRPLPSSHPTDLAAAIRRHRHPAHLAALSRDQLARLVWALVGTPLVRGGQLRMDERRLQRTVALLQRPAPTTRRCGDCGRMMVPVCTSCWRSCGTISTGWLWLYSACHPRSYAACPFCAKRR